MRIESDSLSLDSNNEAYSRYEKTEQMQLGRFRSNPSGKQEMLLGYGMSHTVVEERSFLSSYEEFMKASVASPVKDAVDQVSNELNLKPTANPINSNNAAMPELRSQDQMMLSLLMRLIERLKNDPTLLSALGLNNKNTGVLDNVQAQIQGARTRGAQSTVAIDYTTHESLYQSERSSFSVAGQVKTTDGKTVDINVALQMNREVLETKDFHERLSAVAKDPLVVNFDGTAAQLSGERFSFDLTADGQKDLIPKLQSNSAFLALDINNDNEINDGTELFGAKTGDGFTELSAYDDDKNGWIDENDAVFNNLKLWKKAGTDEASLVDLKSAGIGAIHTAKAATKFHLQNGSDPHENLGVVQATGVFLKEKGGAGTVQQIDLTA